MLPTKTDVLIVGAGPTGLALALGLQQAGIDHVVIDKLVEPHNTSRAGVIHAHTLEMLDTVGVTEELVGLGSKVGRFSFRDRRRALMQLRFDALPSSYRYMLMVPQDITERVLATRLRSEGASIYRGVTATAADQDSGSARVILASPEGESVIRARYVVGADGMHSAVRVAAGVEFEGASYGESFILADVKMDWSIGKEEVSLFSSPEGLVVVAPLPGDKYRIVATLENAPEQPSLRDVQAVMDSRGPANGRSEIREVIWSSRFRVHHRLARSYRHGRFFLMGDAAHVHSPAGGQGMNTGLVDAIVLGQILSGVLHGRRGETELDRYEQLRRPAAAQVLKLAGFLTRLATVKGSVKLAIRNSALSVVTFFPSARQRLIMNLSGLSRKSFAMLPPAPSAAAAESRRQKAYAG
jgi:2-polyprenyl-6-methoxyphenol hydroxylase-like FAD-dependent oxidoreductase